MHYKGNKKSISKNKCRTHKQKAIFQIKFPEACETTINPNANKKD